MTAYPPPGDWNPQAGQWVQPQGDTSHNWMGVAALVSGIMGAIVLAFVFGFLGLNAARRGQANNRMMSIGGIAVASMYLVIVVVVLAVTRAT